MPEAWANLLHAACKECGWPVIDIGINPPLNSVEPYKTWDWWVYCANPLCEWHKGEGYFQALPDWVEDHTS